MNRLHPHDLRAWTAMERTAKPIPSPGLEPPRPAGCPSCAAAEAQCDRMAQRIRELEAALDLEAKARVAAADMAHDAKLALARAEGAATSLVMLLAQIREAVGDDGKRMQPELVDYLRILWEEADPDHVSRREAELRAQDYATPHDPSDAGAWGEDRFEATS